MKSIKTILLIIFVVSGISLHAQSTVLETTSTADTTIIDEYLDRSEKMVAQHQDSALIYAGKALQMSNGINDERRSAHATYAHALAYDYGGKLQLALQWYEEARKAFEALGNYYWTSVSMNGRGVACYFQGDYGKAMDYYLQAVQFQKKHQLMEQEANTMHNIAVLHRIAEKYDDAINIYSQSIPIRKALKDSANLAKVYNNLGVVYTYQEKYPKAIVYLDSAKQLYSSLKDTTNLTGILLSLGDALRNEKSNLDEAYDVLREAYDYLKLNGDNIYQSRALLYLGETQLSRNEPQSAEHYFQQGVSLLSNTQIDDIKKDMHYGLARAQKETNKYQAAVLNLETYISLNDSLKNKEKLKYMEEMQAKYDTQQKETKIEELNQQNVASTQLLQDSKRSIYLLSFGVLLLAGLAFAFYRISAKNQRLVDNLRDAKNKIVEQEKMISIGKLAAGLAHEMNNPINYIHNNALALEMDTKELTPLLVKLQEIKKGISPPNQIKNALKSIDLDVLSSEIDLLITSIKNGANKVSQIVQSLKLISYDSTTPMELYNPYTLIKTAIKFVDTDSNISIKEYDTSDINVHPELMEKCIINMIENALDAIDDDGLVEIWAEEDEKEVHIVVKDNGRGMTKEEQEQSLLPFYTTKDVGHGTGIGLSICYGIVTNHGGDIHIKSELKNGTEIRISLPK